MKESGELQSEDMMGERNSTELAKEVVVREGISQ